MPSICTCAETISVIIPEMVCFLYTAHPRLFLRRKGVAYTPKIHAVHPKSRPEQIAIDAHDPYRRATHLALAYCTTSENVLFLCVTGLRELLERRCRIVFRFYCTGGAKSCKTGLQATVNVERTPSLRRRATAAPSRVLGRPSVAGRKTTTENIDRKRLKNRKPSRVRSLRKQLD